MSSIQNAMSSVSSTLRPDDGSSSSSSFGSVAERARQLDHLAHAVGQPGDERCRGSAARSSRSITCSTASRCATSARAHARQEQQIARRRLVRAMRWRPISRFCSTVACSNSSMFWKVRAMPQRRRRRAAPRGERAGPRTRSRPQVGVIDAADQVEDRRLAGAVRADEGEDLAALHVEADVVDGDARRRSARRGCEPRAAARRRPSLISAGPTSGSDFCRLNMPRGRTGRVCR